MRKSIITLASVAIAVPALIWANPDKIEVKHGANNETYTIWVDDLENLKVFQSEDVTDGFNGITVNFKSGETYDFAIEEAREIKYVPGLLTPSLEMEAEPHHCSITMRIKCDDPDVRYSFGALPIEYFGNHDVNEYHDLILRYEKQLIESYADYLEKDVKQLDPKVIFAYQGDSKITWFPSTTEEYIAMPGKEYVAYVYEGNIDKESGLELSHNVVFHKVTAKTKSIVDTDYQISYEVTPNFITANIESPDDEPYAVFLVPEASMSVDNPDGTAVAQIATLESMVYNYGTGDWDDYIYRNGATIKSQQLCSGDSYYVLVAGCEIGVMTTHAVVSDKITIPYPEVTNDCTFEVETEEVSVSEINLTVTPSDNDTRYLAYLTESGSVSNPREYFTRQIFTSRNYGLLSIVPGEDNPYVFTGKQTLNSIKNLYNGTAMMSGRDYTIYIIGIDEYGTPVTEIKEFNYTPGVSEKRMTFDVTFDTDKFIDEYVEHTQPYDYYRVLNYTIAPSDKEMKYVFGDQAYSERLASMTDDEFIHDWVDGYNVSTLQGDLAGSLSFGRSYTAEQNYDPRLIFLFGFDGSATSELYLFKFEPETGTMTQLRGPGAELPTE